MAILNLRGVPDELKSRLKAQAALAGESLRDHCVHILSGGLGSGVAAAVNAPSDRDTDKRDNFPATAARSSAGPTHVALVQDAPDTECRIDDNLPAHDPDYCQQPGCRECKRLREGQ